METEECIQQTGKGVTLIKDNQIWSDSFKTTELSAKVLKCHINIPGRIHYLTPRSFVRQFSAKHTSHILLLK